MICVEISSKSPYKLNGLKIIKVNYFRNGQIFGLKNVELVN